MSAWVFEPLDVPTDGVKFAVGFYKPSNLFVEESRHETSGAAAERVNFLNGGDSASYQNLRRYRFAAEKAAELFRRMSAKEIYYETEIVENRDRLIKVLTHRDT